MRYFGWLSVYLSILGGSVEAGPDSISQYLMDDSPSMLDYGLLRIELELDGNGYAEYDWDDDEILIFEIDFRFSGGLEEAEQSCAEWISKARILGGVLGGSVSNGTSRYSQKFLHAGFSRTGAPEDIAVEIDKKYAWNTASCSRQLPKLRG